MKLKKKYSLKTPKKHFAFKKKAKKIKSSPALKPGDTPLKEVSEFQNQLYTLRKDKKATSNVYANVHYKKYVELFHEDVPEGMTLVQLRFKICYQLMKIGYERTGIPMPLVIKERYEDVMQFKVDSFPQSLKSVIEIQIRNEQKQKR